VLPGGQHGPDGSSATLLVANLDPISRLTVLAQGGVGSAGAWRGASLSLGYRRTAVPVELAGWSVDHRPSEHQAGRFAPPTADLRYRGLGAVASASREGGLASYFLRAGVTAGTVTGAQLDGASRLVALGEGRVRLTLESGRTTTTLLGGVLASRGSTGGESFTRLIGSGTVAIGTSRRWLRGDWRRGTTDKSQPGEPGRALEEFLVGGAAPPYFDPAFLSQRVPLPTVPSGFVSGHRFELWRVSAGGMTWEPYVVWVAAGDSLSDRKRIAGLEYALAIESIGWVRLPAVQLRVGAGYSFDEPFRRRTRAYASVTYSP
jgi:hypothetical protein